VQLYLIQEAGGLNYTTLHQDGERPYFPIAFWAAHSWDSLPFHFTNFFAGYTNHEFFLCWSIFCQCLTLCRTRAVVATVRYIRHAYDVWTEIDSSPGFPHEGVQRKQSCGPAHLFPLVLD